MSRSCSRPCAVVISEPARGRSPRHGVQIDVEAPHVATPPPVPVVVGAQPECDVLTLGPGGEVVAAGVTGSGEVGHLVVPEPGSGSLRHQKLVGVCLLVRVGGRLRPAVTSRRARCRAPPTTHTRTGDPVRERLRRRRWRPNCPAPRWRHRTAGRATPSEAGPTGPCHRRLRLLRRVARPRAARTDESRTGPPASPGETAGDQVSPDLLVPVSGLASMLTSAPDAIPKRPARVSRIRLNASAASAVGVPPPRLTASRGPHGVPRTSRR